MMTCRSVCVSVPLPGSDPLTIKTDRGKNCAQASFEEHTVQNQLDSAPLVFRNDKQDICTSALHALPSAPGQV